MKQLTSPVPISQVGESPDVAKADRVANHGQHVLPLARPVSPLHVLVSATAVVLLPTDTILNIRVLIWNTEVQRRFLAL